MIPVEKRLWSYIQVKGKDECWPWLKHRDKKGYGHIGMGGRHGGMMQAHRLVYILTKGPIPEGLFVCHSCDNPGCCNPDHLWTGTAADNTNDARSKNRFRSPKRKLAGLRIRGENHGRARLTAADVAIIRNLLKTGLTCQEVANRFNVHRMTISCIKLGKSWKEQAA